jgi:hypothetical protein
MNALLLDEFGREIRPTYVDSRDAAFILQSGMFGQEFAEKILADLHFYAQIRGPRLYGADGEQLKTAQAQVVGRREFRVPFRLSE